MIVIYYHKYLYMFRAFICPSSGVRVVCYFIWYSALGVVAVVLRSRCIVLCTVCKFVSDKSDTNLRTVHKTTHWLCVSLYPTSWIQTYTQSTRLHTVHKTTHRLLRTTATTPSAEYHMQ